MNESKIIKAIYLVAALIAINLAATGYLIFAPAKQALTSKEVGASSADQVPKKVANEVAQRIVGHYNNNDDDGLYAQFADVARIQFTKAQMVETTQKLHTLAGKVEDFAYSHSEAAGVHDGKQMKTLFYKLRLSGGAAPIGDMKISIVQDGDNVGIYGFHIYAGQK